MPEQSEEQAISALRKEKCTLDNFDLALQRLSNNQGLPESLEPWTLRQVRCIAAYEVFVLRLHNHLYL